jgi:hypothetical protein
MTFEDREAAWVKWWASKSPGHPGNVPNYQKIFEAGWDAATTAASSIPASKHDCSQAIASARLDEARWWRAQLESRMMAPFYKPGVDTNPELARLAKLEADLALAESEMASTLVEKTQETFAANVAAGDASNEAEKDARRKVAMDALSDRDFTNAELDAIIQVAQG